MRVRLGVALAGLLVAVAAIVGWLVVRAPERPGVPADASSPAGTPLPDGLRVPAGARLVGQPVVAETAEGAPGWRAVLLVDDDPLRAWRGLVEVLDDALDLSLDADTAPGCARESGLTCALDVAGPSADGRPLLVGARIERVEGDVTGRWTIVLTAEAGGAAQPGDLPSWPGGDAPDAPGARPRPATGEPLATETLADPGDRERYVLLPGSELLVQYSRGSLTGGFGVLLRVSPEADVAEVAAAYAEQARQFDGPVETTTTTAATATVTRLVPPGGAGGYQATIVAVDSATGDDLVYYDLLND